MDRAGRSRGKRVAAAPTATANHLPNEEPVRGTAAQFLLSHRTLLWRTTRSELKSKYAGSVLGMVWAALSPWMILSLYAVVYLMIFRLKVEGLNPAEYVLFVFAGLVPFFMTGEAISGAVSSVVVNRDVLENTVFPIDLAPVRSVLMSQTFMLAGLPVVIIGTLVVRGLEWSVLLVPVLWALHLLALLGLAWPLSLLNVVFRDLQSVVQVLMMALLIASPFAYTPDMVPDKLRFIVALNPAAYYVMAYQRLIVFGGLPSLFDTLFIVIFSFGSFIGGSILFARAKRIMIDYV